VWTISSPFIFIEGAGHLNLLLRGLNPSGSLWTFPKCTWGLAADCLSVSSNSPSFVNTLTSKGHRLVNVYGRSSNKCNDEANSCGKQRRNHKDSEPPDVQTVVCWSNPGTEIVPQISIWTCSNCSSHLLKRVSMSSGERTSYSILHDTLHRGYEGCFTSRDPGWRSVRKRKVLFSWPIYHTTPLVPCQGPILVLFTDNLFYFF